MSKLSSRQEIKFLDRCPPAFPKHEVRRIANDFFGLEGDFNPLVSERDQNFRIQAGDEQYVLKIANVREDPDVINLQVQALLHIQKVDPGVPVPRVVCTKAGQPSTWVEGPDGAQHIARVLTYLPGTELGKMPLTPELLRNLGMAVARLGKALRGFCHPAARHELLWDLQQSRRMRVHTSNIACKVDRERVERVLDDFIANVLPSLGRLRAQIIHHDANGDNVVVSPDRPDQIAGIVDFGDMIHTALATDPAVTASDLFMGGEIVEPTCELLAGYDSVLPLEEEEIDVLYDLVLARCALTAVIIAWRNTIPDGPGYLESYGPVAHAAIERLLTLGRAHVRAKLRTACRFPPYCPKPSKPTVDEDIVALVARRQQLLGATLELSYERPVHVVRGEGPWLFSADGSRLLDAYNNVPQVGHAHPHVARSIARQAAALNTNTRYLYEIVLDYAERLVATMPGGLGSCLFVNSGSEANDAAFRMAKLVTGNEGALVMENAYHGITDSMDALTPYDHARRPLPPHVRTLMAPDPYRGPYKKGQADLAVLYAAEADRAIADLAKAGLKLASFMIDSGFTSNGIPDVPKSYLALVAEKVRAAGGLVIADEVQIGFVRSGTHFWGIQTHDVVPDFVTLGKPIGNGYPLGAVVTTRAILEQFGAQTDFFSTFGGNPVGCAAGIAVLDVIEREGLMENARVTGNYLREGLLGLMDRHDWIGDVRGKGLLIGVELVHETLAPAEAETERVLNYMRENRVLVGREGPHGNVLKIRPPLPFYKEHADILLDALDKALTAL
jgi:4-aminobutyrate aminotransferase-like enzyme/Ser/Thr protein kinase RdoA (MazF antagonist)